jgi:hypothetical protein
LATFFIFSHVFIHVAQLAAAIASLLLASRASRSDLQNRSNDELHDAAKRIDRLIAYK